jgi:hypothetical protein
VRPPSEGEADVTQPDDDHVRDPEPDRQRTVTISGRPLVATALVALFGLRWLRRRARRRRDSAS